MARVHHRYGEHHGILVTVVMVTVMVFNFSILHTPCTLTHSVREYHGVGAVQTAGARWGACRAWVGVVIQIRWQRCQGDSDGGGMERVVVATPRGWWWQHREGGSGNTERVAVATPRGWRR